MLYVSVYAHVSSSRMGHRQFGPRAKIIELYSFRDVAQFKLLFDICMAGTNRHNKKKNYLSIRIYHTTYIYLYQQFCDGNYFYYPRNIYIYTQRIGLLHCINCVQYNIDIYRYCLCVMLFAITSFNRENHTLLLKILICYVREKKNSHTIVLGLLLDYNTVHISIGNCQVFGWLVAIIYRVHDLVLAL